MNTTLKQILEEKLGKGNVSEKALNFAIDQLTINMQLKNSEMSEEECLDELSMNIDFYNRHEELVGREMRKKFVYREAMRDGGNLEKAYQISKEAVSMLFGR